MGGKLQVGFQKWSLFVGSKLIGKYSKSYYLKQVHQPRHLHESARLFGPTILEVAKAL